MIECKLGDIEMRFGVIVVSIIAVVAIGIGLTANLKNDPILTPKNNEVTSISIEQINEGESLGIIETTDKDQIETILKALQNTTKTMRESVNDLPNRDDYFQININGSNSKRLYLYSDREQYFIEDPYVGIYKISREASVSIAKIYTAAPEGTPDPPNSAAWEGVDVQPTKNTNYRQSLTTEELKQTEAQNGNSRYSI